MDLNYDQFNGDTLIFKYNLDEYGNPISIKVDKEEKQVSVHGTIQLEYVPDEYNRVVMLNEDNAQMTEVFNRDEIKPNTYYIDYNNGVAYLDKSQFGKTKIYNYYKKGLQLIGCSRIYDEHDISGKHVVLTLQEIIDAGREALRFLLDIGDAKKVIELLESLIAEGKLTITNLENKKNECIQAIDNAISQATQDKNEIVQEIQENIQEALDSVINVQSNPEVIIKSSDWVLNGDIYEKEITHPCNSENLHVTAKNSNTKEAVTIGYKILDKTRILLKSDEAINMSVILSASYYHATQTISDNIAEEVVKARNGQAKLKDRLDNFDEQLDKKTNELKIEKVNRNELSSKVWSMANMGQDIKEAMTGGSVAVVGKYGVLSENVAPKQITASKLNDNSSKAFIYEKSPLAYGCEKFLNVEYEIGALNGSGQEAINNTKIRSDFFTISGFCKINIEENYTLTLFKYDSAKNFLSLTGVSNGHILDTSIPYYRAVIAKTDGSSPIDIQPFIDSVVYCVGKGNKIVEIDNSIKQSKFKEQAYSLGYENILDLKWEIGALNTSGEEAINNYKIRSEFFNTITPTLIKFLKLNTITISLFKYDSDKNFISFTNATDNDIYLNDNNLYRVVITNLVGEVVTDANSYSSMLLFAQGKNSIAPYKFKKGIVMGDSITARHDERGWVQHFKKITEPINLINIAVPSATWCDKEGTIYDGNPVSAGEDNNRNNVMGNQVQKIINNKYEEPDYIIMACGTNDNILDTITDDEIERSFFNQGNKVPLDSVDRKTFQGSIRYCVEKLREIYPNTDIFICTPIQRTHSDENLGNYTTIRKKSDNIRRIAERVGVQLIDSMKCGVYDISGEPGQDLGDFYDGLHLNKAGAYKLGRYNAITFINWYNY